MSKYIVKNCPAIYGVSLEGCKKDNYEDGTVHCQDCTDCVIKKIYDLCNHYKDVDIIAFHVTQLLQIEEVE